LHEILDLDRFPLDRPDSAAGRALAERCRGALAAEGLFNLEALVRPEALARAVAELDPLFDRVAFHHARDHNIYFKPAVEGLAPDHPALKPHRSANHTLCADQIPESLVLRIYEWQPLRHFLALVLEKPALHLMADPLARANVMRYRAGEALNWHFDRSEFTVTLLLRPPSAGGLFQYRGDLRSESDPNYAGVARLLAGGDPALKTLPLAAGTLNVFKGRHTAHRVTPAEGAVPRLVAVFSYYERPGVTFSEQERIGFYGRAA
jgi:hypothetical protein